MKSDNPFRWMGSLPVNGDDIVLYAPPSGSGPMYSVDNGHMISHSAFISIRMVKISSNFPTANSSFLLNLGSFYIKTLHVKNLVWKSNDYSGSLPYYPDTGTKLWVQHAVYTPAAVPVNVSMNKATCQTPTLIVNLGSVSINAIGHYSEPWHFYSEWRSVPVGFFNCPPNMAQLEFKLLPVPWSSDPANGLLPLLSPSTATDVGVQLLKNKPNGSGESAREPFNFNASYPEYKIPFSNKDYPANIVNNLGLTARMVRLHPSNPPGPGTVHAAMKLVVRYQ